MEALDCIMSRRSVRFYLSSPIEKEKVHAILQAAICAPSGKTDIYKTFLIDKNYL